MQALLFIYRALNQCLGFRKPWPWDSPLIFEQASQALADILLLVFDLQGSKVKDRGSDGRLGCSGSWGLRFVALGLQDVCGWGDAGGRSQSLELIGRVLSRSGGQAPKSWSSWSRVQRFQRKHIWKLHYKSDSMCSCSLGVVIVLPVEGSAIRAPAPMLD